MEFFCYHFFRYRHCSDMSEERVREIVKKCSDGLQCLLDSGCDVNYYVEPEHFTRVRSTGLTEATRQLDKEVARW